MFDFNASLNDFVPVSPILLSVYLKRMKKSGSFMDAIFVLFLLCSPLKPSFAIIVFNFNASPNDVAPVFPILLPIDLMIIGRVNCRWMPFACCFFCAHNSD